MPLISVITPTYNRAALLPRLYASLCRQTFHDFEWIVVDDGSTDNTQEVLAQLSGNGCQTPRIIRKDNGGKHTAVNLGVGKAEGELTLILDSDDELPSTSLSDVAAEWAKAVARTPNASGGKALGGLCGYMAHRNGQVIGRPIISVDCDELRLKYVYHVAGDMCEVFRTDVLRQFPFPQINGERFCPEDLVWDRIAQHYYLHVFPKVIYLRDYLDGGLSDNIVRIRMESPILSMMTYAEVLAHDVPAWVKAREAINYWRFRCCYKKKERNGEFVVPKVSAWWLWTAPMGWVMHLMDMRILKSIKASKMSLHERVKRFADEVWNVGFLENSLDSVINGDEVRVNWIKHDCKDSWFADSFILDVTPDEIVLLVEEFYKPIYRGRISKLTIDRATNELRRLEVVLELPTHLSFPVIIRRNTDFGKILDNTFGGNDGDYVWLMPENGASGKLNVYKYWPKDNRIERIASVLDEAVEDAIPVSIDGATYLFCTLRSNPNGKALTIFKWHGGGKFVPYSHHDFKENVARMAGMFFTHNGKLVRPTQECNVQYGHAVTLQETKLANNALSFHELRRMTSVNSQLRVGSHTFNMYKGVIVTDALGFKNMWLRRLLNLFHIL